MAAAEATTVVHHLPAVAPAAPLAAAEETTVAGALVAIAAAAATEARHILLSLQLNVRVNAATHTIKQ